MKRVSKVLFALLCTMPAAAQVATGIDVLEQQNFALLKEIAARHGGHLNLGILTNPVGIDAHGRRTIDVLRKDATASVPGLSVVTLFSAEHGINAALDRSNIDNDSDTESGLPIVSIYGSTDAKRHPSSYRSLRPNCPLALPRKQSRAAVVGDLEACILVCKAIGLPNRRDTPRRC